MLTQGAKGAAKDSYPLHVEFAWDLMEATYLWPPWMTGNYHPHDHAGIECDLRLRARTK
jgi:hypothetical protein